MGIHRLNADGDPETGFESCDDVSASEFTTPDTRELVHFAHLNEHSGISSGVWKCAPCRQAIDAYPVDEMMTVISGSVTLTGADGVAHIFTAGDSFFVAKGTPLTWEITKFMHKFFMIAE